MEGQCHSGQHHDCHGSANLVSCCQGHYEGSDVGPTSQCTWEYFDHGQQMECGRSDEIIVGRCGSGMNKGQDTLYYRADNSNTTNLQTVLDPPRTGLCVASYSTSMEQCCNLSSSLVIDLIQ